MAFLDNPAIILAHIRQSHVTSDDTGMCEMVLIDHDVDLEKRLPSSVTGSAGSETQGEGGDTQGCDLSQSVDITSSWDFGIRRRSNTVEDLGTLFEKKDFKDRPASYGKQSTLSLRLEQCPQQLNNPFNEYSKFDGKSGQEKLHPMTVVTMANARVQDLIGLICWQYTSEGREPKLKNAAQGFSLIPVDSMKVTMKEILQKALKKRKGSQKGSGISGEKVEIDPVTNQKASTKFWIRQKPISIDSDLLCACDLVEEKSPSE
ncbi:UNVERIFIED_CONTAM: hypothetical protein FKN15_044975 [Acipenser sinensis]